MSKSRKHYTSKQYLYDHLLLISQTIQVRHAGKKSYATFSDWLQQHNDDRDGWRERTADSPAMLQAIVWFYGISTIVGHLMTNSLSYI